MRKQGWVAVLDTDNGIGVLGETVFSTEAEALALLAQFCRDWWDRDGPSDIDIPEDNAELCTAYFNAAEGERGEVMAVWLPE